MLPILETLGLGTDGREGASDEPGVDRPRDTEEPSPRGREAAYGELSEGCAGEGCRLGVALLFGVPAPACWCWPRPAPPQ